MAQSAEVVIHMDLNKTLLGVDPVKNFTRTDVVYLEEWKGDEAFHAWAHGRYGGEQAREAFITDLRLSKNEPRLIKYAIEYCSVEVDPTGQRKALMDAILSQIDETDCVESFWTLLNFIKSEENKRRVLIVFRTFGTDLASMFVRCRDRGFGSDIVSYTGSGSGSEEPMVWQILHSAADFVSYAPETVDASKLTTHVDVTDGFINNATSVPGPKESKTAEFQERTVGFEETAATQCKAGKGTRPAIYTVPPTWKGDEYAPLARVDKESLRDIADLPAMLSGIDFGSSKLRIMGVQENYKVWSRKNWRNGKPLVVFTATPTPPFIQVCFDDYSFTKSDREGPYIFSLYDEAGNAIDGTRTELQQRYSAEDPFFAGSGNTPMIYTAVLCQKGLQDTAVNNLHYFTSRLKRVLTRL